MAGSGKEDGKDINSPHQSRPGSVMQEEEANDGASGISVSGSGEFANIAQRTVANIRRLQDNVSGGYCGGVQSRHVTSSLVTSPPPGAGVSQYEQENFCVQQEAPDNQESVSLSPLRVHLPSPPPSPRAPPSPPVPGPAPRVSDTEDPNWQSYKSSVRERNSAMFNNSLMADIFFMVGPPPSPRRIPAHRYVLATGSTVFYAMLYGGLADKEAEEIVVPDVDPEAFLAMLKYLYCDDIQLEPDTVLATLYSAKKYIVPHLARECVRFLETSLTARNACLLLSQARSVEPSDQTK